MHRPCLYNSAMTANETSSLDAALSQQSATLAPHFKPAYLQRNETCFQFEFDSDEPFYLVVNPDGFEFISGYATDPTLTLFIDGHATCWDLLSGKTDGMDAFLSGRYRADGQIVLSQLLLYLFKHDDPTLPHQVRD